MSGDVRTVVSARFPRVARSARTWAGQWNRLGEQTAFYVQALVSIREAVVKYKAETLRVVSEMSLGVGALALLGGEVVILLVLTGSAAATTGIFGYVQASSLGVGAITGFFSAYANVRLQLPLVVANGLAATIGAGATAQLGAMRISEEIDALEVMGIKSISYLVSTRIMAGLVVIIPLYSLGLIMSFLSPQIITTVVYGQASGTYEHYFRTFLRPNDVFWSFVEVIIMAGVVMLTHCYYGYTASGGPVGVGEAVGRSMRLSLVSVNVVVLLAEMALYGVNPNFNFTV